jgi:hypothetical protein
MDERAEPDPLDETAQLDRSALGHAGDDGTISAWCAGHNRTSVNRSARGYCWTSSSSRRSRLSSLSPLAVSA